MTRKRVWLSGDDVAVFKPFALSSTVALILSAAACSQPTIPITRKPASPVSLSAGLCPLIHCNTSQTGALPVAGPHVPSHLLGDADIDHFWSSPIAGGILDYTYANGITVFWVPQVDRIMKLRLNAQNELEKIAELPLKPAKFPRFEPDDMRRTVSALDARAPGSDAYAELADAWKGYETEGLRAYYAMVSNQGILYVGNRDSVVAYSDAEEGNPLSGIVKVGQYGFDKFRLQLGLKMPVAIMIGMNVTPDGRIIAVTIDGTIIAMKPDLSEAVYHNLPGEQIWNSLSVDENGAIYLMGSKRIHKIIWTGSQFSTRPEDGAWSEAYAIGPLDETLRGRRGSGTTPVLVGGRDDEDKLVATADGADVNNLILYWRDEIPESWQQLPGTTSRRVAGLLPVNFGDPTLTNSYSENAAVVFDDGMVLANNQVKTNEKMTMDVQLVMRDASRTPYGVEKFRWNRQTRRLEVAWIRADVSSPNSTPVVTTRDRQLHVVGIKNGNWVLETLDWDTGATRAIYTLGPSERFNPVMLALQVLPNGDPLYAGFAGLIHLRLGAAATPRPQ